MHRPLHEYAPQTFREQQKKAALQRQRNAADVSVLLPFGGMKDDLDPWTTLLVQEAVAITWAMEGLGRVQIPIETVPSLQKTDSIDGGIMLGMYRYSTQSIQLCPNAMRLWLNQQPQDMTEEQKARALVQEIIKVAAHEGRHWTDDKLGLRDPDDVAYWNADGTIDWEKYRACESEKRACETETKLIRAFTGDGARQGPSQPREVLYDDTRPNEALAYITPDHHRLVERAVQEIVRRRTVDKQHTELEWHPQVKANSQAAQTLREAQRAEGERRREQKGWGNRARSGEYQRAATMTLPDGSVATTVPPEVRLGDLLDRYERFHREAEVRYASELPDPATLPVPKSGIRR